MTITKFLLVTRQNIIAQFSQKSKGGFLLFFATSDNKEYQVQKNCSIIYSRCANFFLPNCADDNRSLVI